MYLCIIIQLCIKMESAVLNRPKRRQVVLNIPSRKYHFIIDLLKNYDYVQIEESDGDSKEEIVANLTQAFKELKLLKEGKLEGRPVEEILNEI